MACWQQPRLDPIESRDAPVSGWGLLTSMDLGTGDDKLEAAET